MTYHDPDVHVTMTPPVAEALCEQAQIYRYDPVIAREQGNEWPGVPARAWFDWQGEGRWTWALDEATKWAIVRLAEMDSEWEDATRTGR